MKSKMILVGALAISLAFTGCGNNVADENINDNNVITANDANNGKQQELSTKDLLDSAMDKMNAMKSFDMSGVLVSKMSYEGQEQSMEVKVNSTLFTEPFKSHITTALSLPNFSDSEMEIYIEQVDDKLVMYRSNEDGTWSTDEVTPEVVQNITMNPTETVKLYIDNFKEINQVGEEQLNGKDATVIEIIAEPKIFSQVATQMIGQGLDIPEEYFLKTGDLKYKIWVTDEGITKMVMDLEEIFKLLADAILADTNASEELKQYAEYFGGMSITSEFNISNINTASDFTIPDEVKQ